MTHEPDHQPSRRDWIGYWSMIVQQTQNAFNDKAAQFILVPLGGAIGFAVESWAAVMITLPFVLFAPIAGWLSDRFSKRDVMFGAAVAQLLILAWLALAIYLRNMPLALVGFFALAVQSAFFSPAKIGINKELVGSRHLGFAAGIQQMMAILAILVGQIIAGIVYDKRYQAAGGIPEVAWQAALVPMVALCLLSISALVFALIVPRVPAHGTGKITWSLSIRHFVNLKHLWSDLPLRRASFGVAFFWGFATYINLWSIKVAKVLTDGQEGFGSLSSCLMAAASIGMMAGFGTAAFLLRRRIELGWVPIAGVMMTLMGLVAASLDPSRALGLLEGQAIDLSAALTAHTGVFLWSILLLAYFAAVFLAPLNAWMQDRYPAHQRGELQSAVNLQNSLAGITAAICIEVLARALDLTGMHALPGYQVTLALGALACGWITYYIIRLLHVDFVRVISLTIFGLFYRVRPVYAERMPKSGGVLLLPNHVSWADAFFLSAASQRPIRFVMDATYMRYRPVRWFCQIFNTVPIDLSKPRDALKTASAALAQGDVVCLFPEGKLTRTGTLQELKRGFELIARKSGAPVVPAWLDGAWGSIFSYERHRFFHKLPYRIPYVMKIVFGQPLPCKEAKLEAIHHGILQASTEAIESRLPNWQGHDSPRHTANGYQIGQTAALPRHTRLMRLEQEPDLDPLLGLPAFAKLFRSPIRTHPPHRAPDAATTPWIGGSILRQRLRENDALAPQGIFFDFSSDALDPIKLDGWIHCPCLAIDGIIIAMSMPDSPDPDPKARAQPGRRPNTYGRLLPGFCYELHRHPIHLSGPALDPDGLTLPPSIQIDADGFLHDTGRA